MWRVCLRECLLELCGGGLGPFNEQKWGKKMCAWWERKIDELGLIIITGPVSFWRNGTAYQRESSRKYSSVTGLSVLAVYIQFFLLSFCLFVSFFYYYSSLPRTWRASCMDLLVSDISADFCAVRHANLFVLLFKQSRLKCQRCVC